MRYNDRMARKKILYVITKSVWGGAQRYVYDLATNLPKNRFGVTVAAGGNGPLFDKLQMVGIRTIQIPTLERDIHIYSELRAFWHLARLFVKERPDISHLNSTKVGILGAITAKLASLVTRHSSFVIFTAHGWGFMEPRPRWQKIAIFTASAVAALFQGRIIVLSRAEYRLSRRFISRKKLALIPLGIATPDFLSKKQARAAILQKIRFSIAPNAILTGTIAELTKNKGIVFLLDALSRLQSEQNLSRIAVIIIGEGEERPRLEKEIRRSNLGGIVRLAGFIPDASSLLKGFDMFILPSLKEGFPYTIIEAMAAEIPVVATSVGGIPDLLENDKEGLLVPTKNPDALGRAILELSKDPSVRARMGGAAVKKAEEQFLLAHMIQKTITQYE